MVVGPGAVEGLVMSDGAIAQAFAGKRVLVTGHTGFKGSWLALWLKQLGATVGGVGLAAPTTPNAHELFQNFAFDQQTECDLRNTATFDGVLKKFSPDLV